MKRYSLVFLPIIVGSILVLMTIVFALPKARNVFKMKGEIKQRQEKLARLMEKEAFLKSLDEYQLTEKTRRVERALPSKKEVATLLIALRNVSQKANVSLSGFSLSPGSVYPQKFERLDFKITITGAEKNISQFLKQIRQVLPLISITDVKIEKERAILSLETYFSPLPQSLGKIDKPLPKISAKENEVYQKLAGFSIFTDESSLPVMPLGKQDPFSQL